MARKHIRDPELLALIDAECFVFSTVPASHTPMINAGMVLSDRFYGHVNYPRGGVGRIPQVTARFHQARIKLGVLQGCLCMLADHSTLEVAGEYGQVSYREGWGAVGKIPQVTLAGIQGEGVSGRTWLGPGCMWLGGEHAVDHRTLKLQGVREREGGWLDRNERECVGWDGGKRQSQPAQQHPLHRH